MATSKNSGRRSTREEAVYSEMLIAAVLSTAGIISGQTDEQVIAHYKKMLQVLRVKGTQ